MTPERMAEVLEEINNYGLESIQLLAINTGWLEIDHQQNIRMISFKKDDMRINVYYGTMTVGTCLNHPKKGKTQMFRRNVLPDELRRLFTNPRTHLNKGYREKRNAPD